MSAPAPPLLRLPPEVFSDIVFEVAATQPLGPPYAVLPLLLACKATHELSAHENNTVLWSRIFRYKFDSEAIARRAFVPTPTQCVDQLVRYCQAMQVLRAANRFRSLTDAAIDSDNDISLEEALMVAMTMMMEDDGKNMRQLEEWAELRQLLWSVLKHRLYEGSTQNDGWARENQLTCYTLWLMWLMTTEESLKNETAEERDLIRRLILPFVVMPYRYASVLAPPHHYHLPLPVDDDFTIAALTTITTVHGEYPLYPSLFGRPRTIVDVHYGTRPNVSTPLAAVAAKLIYFAREELRGMPVPPHFARDRDEWIARGNDPNGIGITKADVDEWNWGWAARLPGGAGKLLSACWLWGAGDDDLAHARDFNEDTISITDVERALGLTSITPPAAPAVTPTPATAPTSTSSPPTPATPTAPPASSPQDNAASSAIAPSPAIAAAVTTSGRWTGKAPHSQRRGPKSKSWDADWWRYRLCGSPARPQTRVRYGKVYEPGCMDGLWHGRLMMPSQDYYQELLMNQNRPADFSPEATFGRIMVLPLYARFREAHRVIGQGDQDLELGSTDPEDENMNNAWLDGDTGKAMFKTRGSDEREVEITVLNGGDRRKRGVFPCYDNKRSKNKGEGLGLGNAAFSRQESSPSTATSSSSFASAADAWSSTAVHSTAEDDDGDFKGYEHDEDACEQCESRRRIARELRRERLAAANQREQLFASVGLGMPPGSPSHSSSGSSSSGSSTVHPASEASTDTVSTADEYDPDQDEWEQFEDEEVGPDGTRYPANPRTHDRSKLATGGCDGIEEIYLFGETDLRHSQAFRRYRFYGRVRSWDGLIGVLRVAVRNPHAPANEPEHHSENFFFYGYLVGGENFVGTWRIASIDPIAPAWEGPFVMSRRED